MGFQQNSTIIKVKQQIERYNHEMKGQNKQVFLMLLLLSMIMMGSSQTTFSFFYNATYVCLSDLGTKCQRWQLSITIVQQNLACFPYYQKVMTKNGPKQMRFLQIGDELLSYDPNNQTVVYSKMTSWLHKLHEDHFQSKYLKITTEDGFFHISPLHNIAITKNQTLLYVYAEKLTVGDQLYFGGSKIVEIQMRSQLGVYTPLTQNFNFFLVPDKTNTGQTKIQELVLVHCFANIKQPTFYEPFFSLFAYIFEYLGLAKYTNRSIDGISPLAKTLMKVFPYLLDQNGGIQMVKPNNAEQAQFSLNSNRHANANQDNDRSQTRVITFLSFINDVVLGL